MESKILKLSAILIALVFIGSGFAFAASEKAPEIEWNKTFGGSDWDWGKSVQQTKDGGYIITAVLNDYLKTHHFRPFALLNPKNAF